MNLAKLLCLLSCAIVASAAPMAPRQSDASYEAALRNQSTSPSYVLITVIDARTGVASTNCTFATFLLGAIHIDGDLPYDPEGEARGMQIALRNKAHVFTFERPKALHNVARHYTDEDLARVRKAIQGMSIVQVQETMSHGPSLNGLVHGDGTRGYDIARDAVACALIERGASPGMADMTGQLTVPAR